VSGLNRQQLQQLERSGALSPVRKGKSGRGNCAAWTPSDVVTCSVYACYLKAGCRPGTASAAAKWCSVNQPEGLLKAQGKGRALLSLDALGGGRLVQPPKEPLPQQRHLVEALDLSNILRKVREGLARFDEKQAEQAGKLARTNGHTA
jgi:hypothetical protein